MSLISILQVLNQNITSHPLPAPHKLTTEIAQNLDAAVVVSCIGDILLACHW